MNEKQTEITASIGLLAGGIFGIAGSSMPSDSLRALAWGIDGVGLVLASALLTVYYFRKGLDATAAGFLVFAIGQGLILATAGGDLQADAHIFGAGTALWAVSLFLISIQKTYPIFLRITGLLASVLFFVVTAKIFAGENVNAMSEPLPSYAYPVFVITLFGWAWTLSKKHFVSAR